MSMHRVVFGMTMLLTGFGIIVKATSGNCRGSNARLYESWHRLDLS